MRNIYYYYALVKPHQHPLYYLFSFQFFYNCFNIYFFNFYTFPIFLPLLPFHFSTTSQTFLSLSYIFIFPLPSTLISFFLFSFIFLYFFLFLFTTSYYKTVTISSILCIVFPHKENVLSLSLSLSIFWCIFIFLVSLLRGVARIFNMGGPIFDDDDYYRRMDSLYI